MLGGETEARFTFLAVRRWFGWSAGQILLFDIGGGSLEIAHGGDEIPDVASSVLWMSKNCNFVRCTLSEQDFNSRTSLAVPVYVSDGDPNGWKLRELIQVSDAG